jgi:hypothetical protein
MSETPHKIFNIGFNRAGTSSLTEALQLLGYRAVHFRHQEIRLHDIIVANRRAGRRLLFGLEDQYDAFSDFAGQHFFEQIDAQYPGSKFIVTLRNLDDWLDSRERKVLKNRSDPNYRHFFLEIDRPGWIRERAEASERIARHFRGRPDDLLYIDIPAGDGWQPLCRFLGIDSPDCPFPWKNRLAQAG